MRGGERRRDDRGREERVGRPPCIPHSIPPASPGVLYQSQVCYAWSLVFIMNPEKKWERGQGEELVGPCPPCPWCVILESAEHSKDQDKEGGGGGGGDKGKGYDFGWESKYFHFATLQMPNSS
jgi:hypothetical protein